MIQAFRHTVALPLCLGAFFLCLYLVTGASDLLHNGDTLLRYQTTQALVDHHRLWIDHPRYTDSRVALGRGHHLYAFYGPGQTLLMVPLYVAGKVLAHHLALPYDITTQYATRSLDLFLGALLAVLFFLLARSAGYADRIAALLTLVFGLATVAWPDAQSALEQTQVNVFLLLAVLGIWQFRRGEYANRRWLLLAGTGVGLAFATRYDALIYLPVLGLVLAAFRWVDGRRGEIAGDALAFLASVSPWIALVVLWNIARFGSPLRTGLSEQTLGNPFPLGLAELTVSPGKGLLWYVPLLLLLPWAGRRFLQRSRALAVLCCVLALVPLLFYANILYWHGDPAWGPRYLYVTVPYLILPLGELLVAWSRLAASLKATAAVLLIASIALQLCAVSVTQWRFWYRLQAYREQSANANTWTGQPFHWGARHYHYYWDIRLSPIVIQVDNVYQVSRLLLGAERYQETLKPGSAVSSNTADNYPVNEFNFWWADSRHPLLGPHTRDVLAALLVLGALGSLAGVVIGAGGVWDRQPFRLDEALPEIRSSATG